MNSQIKSKYFFSFLNIICIYWIGSGDVFAQSNNLKSPQVSANALFLYRHSKQGSEDLSTERNGLDIEEAEVAFYSDVDPYTRLNVLLSVHPEYEVSASEINEINESFAVEPEELYAESNQISNVTLKVGKFKAFFGKHNYLHTHVFPFIDAPLANENLLGPEGLNDVGLSAAFLLPTNWYNELSLQFLRGEGSNKEFNSPTPGDGVGLVHWKNLVDLSESLTAELGGSFAQGKNSFGGTTSLKGADLTFKYRPLVGGKYRSWILGGEYIQRSLEQPNSTNELGEGWNIWMKYQFAERWSALARYDFFHRSGGSSIDGEYHYRDSAALVFAATEFSAFQLEYNYSHRSTPEDTHLDNTIFLQANFTIGAHPAHTY